MSILGRFRLGLATFLGLAGGAFWGLWQPSPTQLSFLCVGQGDCAVFQHRAVTVVVDAAPADDDWDAGERMAVPEMRRLGVDRIDLLLLSHPDSDHLGGLSGIASRIPIGTVAVPESFRDRPEVLAEVAEAGIPTNRIIWTRSGQTFRTGEFRIDVLHTHPADNKDNQGSMIVRITNGRATGVLTGDAPVEEEVLAIEAFADTGAQVLKAGHHGSKGSTGDGLLLALKPSWVVFSARRNNRYGHPADETIQRVRERGARVWRTDRQGTATFVAGPSGFELEP